MKKLVASSAQVGEYRVSLDAGANTSIFASPIHDLFLYGAFGELMGAIATRSQTTESVNVPQTNVMVGPSQPCHSRPIDSIGQTRLAMSFGMVGASIS